MIDQQCKADQEKFNKVRLLLVCILMHNNILTHNIDDSVSCMCRI